MIQNVHEHCSGRGEELGSGLKVLHSYPLPWIFKRFMYDEK
jgi:hypothetical protein